MKVFGGRSREGEEKRGQGEEAEKGGQKRKRAMAINEVRQVG